MKNLIIVAALMAACTAAVAKDKFPYKDDGSRRDWYLQTSIRACTQDQYWMKLGSEQEVLDFCNCKALYLADALTDEDVSEQYRAQTGRKIPAELQGKWQASYGACMKHFTKLPPVPSRER
jgi:hypothetical protein